ncbi:MAG: hypothetical protein JST04_13215 [Bdellovibrionales bacterium]|nr:hypothetical protein [Bdellovibrionales bacterium]
MKTNASIRLLASLGFISALLSACHKEIDFVFSPMSRHETFTVQTGAHYFLPRKTGAMGSATVLMFAANLHSDTVPSNAEEVTRYNGVNKLFGFNDCKSWDPQKNSARVGWYFHETKELPNDVRPLHAIDGKKYVMDVLPFVDHAAGDPPHEYDVKNPLASIELDRFYQYKIEVGTDRYVFSIYDGSALLNSITVDRHCTDNDPTKLVDFPYFGGVGTAPHPMTIDITLLDQI